MEWKSCRNCHPYLGYVLISQTKTHFNLLCPLDVEPEVTKPQSQTTNLLTESLKNAQKKKKSIFDDSDDSESDSENDVYQDTTNDSTTKVDHTENSEDAKWQKISSEW